MILVPFDEYLQQEINHMVRFALAQDLGVLDDTCHHDLDINADITAQLIDAQTRATATIITRESGVFCGQAWLNTAAELSPWALTVNWQVKDGQRIEPNQTLCTLQGSARALLTLERTILNFLQTLSGTASQTNEAVTLLGNSTTKLLDTRKTIPGMRFGQKYAVMCGGGKNHRLGLFDAYLIKENHILASGSISKAIHQAKSLSPDKLVEIEVESLDELQQALEAGADWIMLDNFSLDDTRQAVQLTQQRAKLEISGNVTKAQLNTLKDLGVDYISSGSLTKHIKALDLSMRLD